MYMVRVGQAPSNICIDKHMSRASGGPLTPSALSGSTCELNNFRFSNADFSDAPLASEFLQNILGDALNSGDAPQEFH